MVEIRIQETKKVDLTGGVVIDGLPGLGWVSTISSACLISSLALEPVGVLESESFPSLAMVYASEPHYAARIHADERKKLSVFIAEFPIKQTLERFLSQTIIKWSQAAGSSLIVTSTGFPQEEEGESEKAEVLGVGSTPKARSLLTEAGIRILDYGAVPGISGLLLVEGRRMGLDVIAILVGSDAGEPDPVAGAKVGETIGRFVPQARCDVEPIMAEARKIETRLKNVSAGIRRPPGGMYG